MSGSVNPVIVSFIEQYKKDHDAYDQLCESARKRLKGLVDQKGIMALVSARVKDAERLEQKLVSRDAERVKTGLSAYQSAEEIFEDIPDLVGARIALYFPSDAEKIGSLLSPHFIQVTPKVFPEKVEHFDELVQQGYTAHKRKIYPGYDTRRFDGYCAQHYRVRFADQPVSSIPQITIEIQVASVLMHAWSEVEHDLAYKKMMGSVTREEYECLDEINGLVMAGEIALNRLNQLSEQRIQNISVFDTHYTLAAYLTHWQKSKGYANQPLGNVEILFNSYQEKGRLSREHLNEELKKLERQGYDAVDPLADQLLERFAKKESRNIVKKLISQAVLDMNDPDPERISESQIGSFLGKWNSLEDRIKKVLRARGYTYIKRRDLIALIEKKCILSEEFGEAYARLRHMRDQIVRGYLVPSCAEYTEAMAVIEWMTGYLKETHGA